MFIRITACRLADPLSGLLHQGLRAFHCFHARLGCYRLERKLPGGFIYSPTGVLRLSTAHPNRLLRSPPSLGSAGLHQALRFPSPPSDGGEGWGEEVRFYWFPLSSVPHSFLAGRGWRA